MLRLFRSATTAPFAAEYYICVEDLGPSDGISYEVCTRELGPALSGVTASKDDLAPGLPLSGTIVLPATDVEVRPGVLEPTRQSGGIISVPTAADNVKESNEDYVVILGGIQGGVLDDQRSKAFGHIRNDDDPDGPIYFMTATSTVVGQPLTFTVRRFGNTSEPSTLTYDVTSTATQVITPAGEVINQQGSVLASPDDYTLPADRTISFSADQSSATFSIPTTPRQNGVIEPTKFLPVRLTITSGGGTYAVRERVGYIEDNFVIESRGDGQEYVTQEGGISYLRVV